MINIGSKELSAAYIGGTEIKEIYLGSKLVWPTDYVEWYDSEFGTVVEKALNNSKRLTTSKLASITNDDFSKVSFRNNTTIVSIRDLEKFTNVTTIPSNCFNGCTKLGTAVPDGATASADDSLVGDDGYVYSTLTIPSNISILNVGAFYKCEGYKSIVVDHAINCLNGYGSVGTGASAANEGQVFALMRGIEGTIDLSKITALSKYHEFDQFGDYGSGCKVIMPVQKTFGHWFISCNKVTSMAGSADELEDNVLKIPEGYVETVIYPFSGNSPQGTKIILPSTMTTVASLAGGDGSWTYYSVFDIDANCTKLSGGVLSDNYKSHIIICRATTPPVMEVHDYWGMGGPDYDNYPFAETEGYISAIYVPDDSVDAYKADTKYIDTDGNEGTGEVTCYKSGKEQSYTIGWSRFASKIKPLSEYTG